jgi:transcriptional regulator with XRE-family HTH domain
MDTNLVLRLQALRLIRLGVTQKTIAGRMGMSEGRFSQWLRNTGKVHPRLPALDGFRQFLSEVQSEVTRDVTTLPAAELEQLIAEAGATQTEQTVRRKMKKRADNARRVKGKKVAVR